MKQKNISIKFALQLFCLVTSTITSLAQTPNWAWVKQAGGIDYDTGKCITKDNSGNIYVAGTFTSSSIVFGSYTLTNNYNKNIYVVKYDTLGNVQWAKTAGPLSGGANSSAISSICTDVNGNIFITGDFSCPNITFDSYTLTNLYTGQSDFFIVKYDSSGNVLWAKSASSSENDCGNGITCDLNGNVIATGFYNNYISFGTTTLTSPYSSVPTKDVFVVKYDAAGNVLWAKTGDGTSNGTGITTDATGNIFVTGMFGSDSITFGTNTIINSNGGYDDIFLVKFDAFGNVIWLKKAGGANFDGSSSICTDINGNIILAGYFKSPTITLGATTLTNSGNADLLVIKYNSSGNVIWAKAVGGSLHDWVYAINTDINGNIYITGGFGSWHLTFGSTTLTNSGGAIAGTLDVFVVKYDALGNALWAIKAGGIKDDYGLGISILSPSSVFISGDFASFPIHFGSIFFNVLGNTAYDMFFAKISTTTSTISIFENEDYKSVIVFPNPVITEATLKFSEEQKNSIVIIMDVFGKEIKIMNFSGKELIIKKEEINEGIYFVRIIDENNNVMNKKIIIQ